MQFQSLSSDVSICDADVGIGVPLPSLASQVAKSTKSLAEQVIVLSDQACTVAEQAAARTKSLAEQARVLAEQAALLDLTHDSIFVRDMNDQITFWNKGAATTYGWSAEQALGQVTHELLQTQFPSPLHQIQAALLADGHWEGELIHSRSDQSSVVVASRWALQRDTGGNPQAILEINNEITRRKRAEDALRLSEERLNLLIRGVKDHAIYMLDLDGLIVTWHDGAQRIKGYAPTEIIGQHFSRFYTPDDIAKDKPAQALRVAREQGYFEDEGWRVRKDGSRFWASVVITALRDDKGHLRGFGKVTRDGSARKQAEILLEKARQDQLLFKDDFLSHVSHELRSPLAAIDSFTAIIADGLAGETNAQQNEYLGIILKNTAQLQSMVNDLLEVTREKSGKLSIDLQPVSLRQALLDAFNTIQGAAKAKGVEFTVHCASSLPSAYADPMRLLQVLIILCDNAIKFTPAGGAVKVEAGVFDKDPHFLLLQVSDTGCGIDPKSVARIFEHRYQVSDTGSLGRRGLGLGLHIAKGLVSRLGGEIWVSSELQHGSTFTFTLPSVTSEPAANVAGLPNSWPASQPR